MRHLFRNISFSTYFIVVFGCAICIGWYKFLDRKFKKIDASINYVRTQVTQLAAPEDLVDAQTAADIARQVFDHQVQSQPQPQPQHQTFHSSEDMYVKNKTPFDEPAHVLEPAPTQHTPSLDIPEPEETKTVDEQTVAIIE